MRLPASLLLATAFIVGCSTDEDPSIAQSILITSNPTSAAIRLNGDAVGRTPATITVESNADYQLEVGKGGFISSVTELKPSLKTDSKGNMFYGFPEKISVSLDRVPGSDDVKVPEEDAAEFKRLADKAKTAEERKVAEAGSAESKQNSLTDINQDVATVKTKLAERDAADSAKLEGLKKSLAEAKGTDATKVDDTKIAALEAQIAAQEKAAAADRQSTAELLKALAIRTEELIRMNNDGLKTAKAEATKDIEEQKAAAAKQAEDRANAAAAKELTEQKAIAAKEAEEKAQAEAAKQLEATKAEADQQLASVQRVMEEQKTLAAKAEEQRATAEQQRVAAELEAKKRTYADFNSRYALLESRRRNKEITEAEFKEQLSALRKELTK